MTEFGCAAGCDRERMDWVFLRFLDV